MSTRETFAALLGMAFMLGVMLLAQFLDSDDLRNEQTLLRVQASSVGFEEGMHRIRCAGGLRYDLATGGYLDTAPR